MSDKLLVYPEWVQQYRTQGHTIKKKGDSYYLYKRTSRRVPGKKYPQPVDTYVGVITPNGVINAEKKIVPAAGVCDVYEYGFSKALLTVCPADWKKAVGEDWQNILYILITKCSKESYLNHEINIPDENNYRVAWNAQYGSLLRRIKALYKVTRNELEQLKYIYIVHLGKARFISRISTEQQELLKRLGMPQLEVH